MSNILYSLLLYFSRSFNGYKTRTESEIDITVDLDFIEYIAYNPRLKHLKLHISNTCKFLRINYFMLFLILIKHFINFKLFWNLEGIGEEITFNTLIGKYCGK